MNPDTTQTPRWVIKKGKEQKEIGKELARLAPAPKPTEFDRVKNQEPLFPPVYPKQVLTAEERTEQLRRNSEAARLKELAPDDLHAWMKLQEEINKEVAGELRYLREEIQKLKKPQSEL
jgi:hypothetical protein